MLVKQLYTALPWKSSGPDTPNVWERKWDTYWMFTMLRVHAGTLDPHNNVRGTLDPLTLLTRGLKFREAFWFALGPSAGKW